MNELNDRMRALAARRGIDLTALAAADTGPSPLGTGWTVADPAAARIEMAEAVLAAEMRGTFANAKADHPEVARWVSELIETGPDSGDRLPWLTLMGATGRGKTHQAYGAIRALALAAARRPGSYRPYRWRIVTHPELSAALRPKSDKSHEHALEIYEVADLLLLDDIGAGSLTDFGREGILHLVNHRYVRRLPTIFTTNLNEDALRDAFGDRVPSRMNEGVIVVLDGPDRREAIGEWR